jgi:hypothetical protein
MEDELTISDYNKILKYYKIPIPKSKIQLKIEAEKILSNKLCKCIKKLDTKYESISIGICTKSVLNTKGITKKKFNCNGKRKITLKKYTKNSTPRRKKL